MMMMMMIPMIGELSIIIIIITTTNRKYLKINDIFLSYCYNSNEINLFCYVINKSASFIARIIIIISHQR